MQNVKPESIMENKIWTVELLEDPEDSESLMLNFPDEMLEQAGWKPGDVLVWNIEENGTISITKK